MKKLRSYLYAILAGLFVACGFAGAALTQDNAGIQGEALNGVQYASATNGEDAVPLQKLSGNMYNPDKDTGFTLSNPIDETEFGVRSYTSLSICVGDGESVLSTYNGFTAVGVVGTDVSLRFKINYEGGVDEYLNGSAEWMLCKDTWGKYDTEKVNGVTTGEVGSGALIVQTSYNGTDWSDENKAQYENGLYTTDYYTNYGTSEQTIYVPDGHDISTGIYVRVIYAYEAYDYKKCTHKNFFGVAKHKNDSVYKNYVEEYSFYLCYNSSSAVVFHNLSLDGVFEENLSEEDASMIELVKKSETLTNGSVTTTGFVIDQSLNEAATVRVKKNGVDYTLPANKCIQEDGRYDITVKTSLGMEKKTTIFVNTKGAEELFALYFGENFLSGKRIFTKGELPTYEGGLTVYNLMPVGDNVSLLWGSITNKTTGNVITIEQSAGAQNGVLTEAGEYEVELNSNITYATESASGDNHKFVFRFLLIEQGTAPGPQINQEKLQEFVQLNTPSNLRPVYYGVTFQSAHRGYITLAFASREAAREYAYNYEKGMVEPQSDGSFRYNGSLNVAQKVVYDSAWDLTDAIYYFVDQAVELLHFDLRDEFTYLTLPQDVLETVSNLKTLELTKSVVVIANAEEEAKLLLPSVYPIINAREYMYLTPGADGEVVKGYSGFNFVRDQNGYDSYSVVAIDAKGNRYPLEYQERVDEQLKAYGVETGVITIEETTVYGDVSVYKVVYLAEDDCNLKVNMRFSDNDEIVSKTYDEANNGASITTEAFTVDSLTDPFDSYGLIFIERDGVKEFYSADETIQKTYNEKGVYTITALNRFGKGYSFTIEIKETQYVIQLKGDGIADGQFITYYENDTIILPTLTKYGYNFVGYRASNGQTYSNEVAAIMLKGSAVLETVWEAKKFTMTLQANGAVYAENEVAFGETYELPTLADTEDAQFVGWENENNEIVTTVTVNREGNVSLRAVFVKNPTQPEDSTSSGDTSSDSTSEESKNENEPANKRNTKKKRNGWVWTLLISLSLVGVVAIIVGSAVAYEEDEGGYVLIAIAGGILLLLSILCMIWPSAFWWFIWWYY